MSLSEKLRSQITVTGPYERSGTDKLYGRAYDKTGTRSPQQKWFALGTSSYRRAEDELEYRRMQIWSGQWDPWEQKKPKEHATVQAAVEAYLQDKGSNWAESTVANARKVLRTFRKHVGGRVPIRQIGTEDVQEWLETPTSGAGGSPSAYTLRTYYDRLAALLEWCEGEGLVDHPATADVPRPDVGKEKTYEVLRPKEIDEMIRTVSASIEARGTERRWLLDVLNFQPCAGLRLGELCALRWADVERLSSTSDMATSTSTRITEAESKTERMASPSRRPPPPETSRSFGAGRSSCDAFLRAKESASTSPPRTSSSSSATTRAIRSGTSARCRSFGRWPKTRGSPLETRTTSSSGASAPTTCVTPGFRGS